MSNHDLPELAPELRRLLDAARPGPDVPREDWEHLSTALGPIIGSFGPVQPPQTPPSGTSDAPTSTGLVRLMQSKVAIGVAGLVIGSGLGVGGHAILAGGGRTAPVASSAVMAVQAPSTLASAASTTSVSQAASAMPSAIPDMSRTEPAVSSPSSDAGPERSDKDVELNAERALIDVARAALTRGQPASAIETLARHAQTYPRGRLVEEREALWVRALLMSGQQGQAQLRAHQFQKRFPGSLLLPPLPSSSAPSNP